ncbi:hypothetical protein ACMA1I_17225, partial [Pontibacter sp. 13R65]|uniref:hypothetical protein n=1 Tax=Pontibacter sp. 13R65 TaxID=3127458 RepID=UPI00301C920C
MECGWGLLLLHPHPAGMGKAEGLKETPKKNFALVLAGTEKLLTFASRFRGGGPRGLDLACRERRKEKASENIFCFCFADQEKLLTFA